MLKCESIYSCSKIAHQTNLQNLLLLANMCVPQKYRYAQVSCLKGCVVVVMFFFVGFFLRCIDHRKVPWRLSYKASCVIFVWVSLVFPSSKGKILPSTPNWNSVNKSLVALGLSQWKQRNHWSETGEVIVLTSSSLSCTCVSSYFDKI